MPLRKPKAASASPAAAAKLSLDALLGDLREPDAQTRRDAARALGDFPQAATAICAAVAVETEESVREPLFTALIRIGTKDAASGLIPLLGSEDVALRNATIEALKTMPDSSGECIAEIFAGSTDVRIFGVEILGALTHPDRQSWLLGVIEADSELNVCATAVEALLDCGDRTAIGPLQQLLERYPDEPFLEFSIRSVLARIEDA